MSIDEQLAPDTFDFLGVLSGISYPEDTVVISLDEGAAHLIEKIENSSSQEDIDPDTRDKMNEKVASAREALRRTTLRFYLRGFDSDTVKTLNKVAKNKFPDRKMEVNGMKIPVPTPEQEEYATALTVAAFTHKVEQVSTGAIDERPFFPDDPDGTKAIIAYAEKLSKFLGKIPESQSLKLRQACNELSLSAEAFEDAIGDDFLAKP